MPHKNDLSVAIEVRLVTCHVAIQQLLLFPSIPPFSLSLWSLPFRQSSHLSCFPQPLCFFASTLFGSLSSFILTVCPANLIRLFTILTTQQSTVPLYYLRYFNLLHILFAPAFRLIQSFLHTCSLCGCCSDRAAVIKPYTSCNYTSIQNLPFRLSWNLSIHHSLPLFFSVICEKVYNCTKVPFIKQNDSRISVNHDLCSKRFRGTVQPQVAWFQTHSTQVASHRVVAE